MLVSPGPSAQTPYLIYVGVYPLPPTSPNPEQDLGTQQRFHGGTNDGGNREKQRREERKRKGNLCSVGINKALSN